MDMRRGDGLKLIGYLDNANHYFVRIAILIDEIEFYDRIVFAELIFHVCDLVVEKVLLDVVLEDLKRVGEIHFQWTRVVG
jgi:hypothetical protein